MKRFIGILTVLMMVFTGAACAEGTIPGLEDGVLTVAMECAYAPYNWAQPDDSNGAVAGLGFPDPRGAVRCVRRGYRRTEHDLRTYGKR